MSGTRLATYVLSSCDIATHTAVTRKRLPQIALHTTGRFPAIMAFGDQGCSWEMPSTIIKEAQQYLVALYGHKDFESLDKIREHIFETRKSDLRVLPPTEYSFYHYVLRSLYQFVLYKKVNNE